MDLTFLNLYWVKIGASLLVFIGLMGLFFRQSRKQAEGNGGASIRSKVEKLGEDYTLLSGVVVPALRGMSRIDHVIISPYGVFVLTVQNEPGRVWGKVNGEMWDIKSGRQKGTLYNPLWENRKWVNALEKHLGRTPFIPLVVFTQAKLKSDFGDNVIPLSRLPGFIKKYDKPRIFSDKLESILEKLNFPQEPGGIA
jgi:restriction system protein